MLVNFSLCKCISNLKYLLCQRHKDEIMRNAKVNVVAVY